MYPEMEQAMTGQRNKRDPRSRVELTGRFRTGSGRVHVVRVSDLSVSGCRLHQNFSLLDVGKTIMMRLADIGPIESVVRWRNGMDIGVSFEHPLHPAVLDHLLARYRLFERETPGEDTPAHSDELF